MGAGTGAGRETGEGTGVGAGREIGGGIGGRPGMITGRGAEAGAAAGAAGAGGGGGVAGAAGAAAAALASAARRMISVGNDPEILVALNVQRANQDWCRADIINQAQRLARCLSDLLVVVLALAVGACGDERPTATPVVAVTATRLRSTKRELR